jgi:tetratricopeptide (TPR) repeat protein
MDLPSRTPADLGGLLMSTKRMHTTILFASILLLIGENIFAQRPERDWSTIEWGGQDYYRAIAVRPYIKRSPGATWLDLLDNVETNHLNKQVLRDFSTGRYEYVIDNLKYALGAFPNHPMALAMLGSVAKLTKKMTLASPFFENALQLYPQYAMTHAQYGEYLASFQMYDDGIAKLQSALHIDPKLGIAHAWLAEAYFKTGKNDLGTDAALKARQYGYRDEIAGYTDDKPSGK